jgi:hypothetical protein
MASPEASPEIVLDRVKKLHQDLSNKKTFCSACSSLAQSCEKEDLPDNVKAALYDAGQRAFTVLQSRFTNPKFWQAGLEFFLALEFHFPETSDKSSQWRQVAMEEVDEEAREQAEMMQQKRRLEWEKKFNQGRFSDANTPITRVEELARHGVILLDAADTRPAMSRDAREELRLVTVTHEDNCPICQEPMKLGSKAKAMPCGHLYHDECLMSWVAKSNSCPMCRNDEMPIETQTFDDVERRIQREDPGRKGIFT